MKLDGDQLLFWTLGICLAIMAASLTVLVVYGVLRTVLGH